MGIKLESNRRRVLIVAYFFPPSGGSGVQRTLKFAKYLPEFGWEPVILTVSNAPVREVDYTMLKELPGGLPIYRTPDFNLVHLLRRTARRLGLIPKDGRHTTNSGLSPSPSRPWPSSKSKLRMTLSRLADTWFRIPDQFVYWLPGAVWAGLRIVRHCEVIYSTSDPFTDHLVAYFLQKLSGKPWVADFRDPWTQYVTYQHSSRLRSRVDAFLEEFLLKRPDVVTVTCPETARGFQALYPSLSKDKFVVITNGFDAEDFDQPVDSEFERFTITYTGRFDSRKKTSIPFLQALRELCNEYPKLASEMQVVFAGMFGECSRALLKEWDLERVVKPLGYVLHHESVGLLLKSHVLLLTLNDELGVDLTYPGKLFEYLAAGKTILALAPEGATADLIRNMDAGVIAPPDDVRAIKQAVLDLYYQYKYGDLLIRTYDDLQQFERRTLTERLAECLDTLVKVPQGY